MIAYDDWQKQHPDKAPLLAACVAAVRSVVPDAGVVLYGSVARGEETADSDVDLLVLVPQEVTSELRKMVHDQLYEIDLEYNQVVTSIIRQRKAWESPPLNYTPLYRSIKNEGVLL
ncbi:MAG: nucleotidyltransferase domain-containing protein [bacterium]